MSFNTNASRMYIVKETVPGTLESPTLGDQAIALQPGFEFTPNVDTQENAEIRATIAPAAPILGIERPTANASHYLRHSGIEGVEPDYALLVESLYGSVSKFYSAMVVSALNNKLNFTDDNGTVTATIASGSYKSPQLLAAAVTTAMNAANGAQTALCVYSTVTGKFTISSTGAVLSLLWKTGANGSDNTDTHIGTLLGYSDAANDTLALTYDADNATNGIERVTDAGCTTSALVLTAGGADFDTKKAVLVKGAVYEIRPVQSRSGQTLTLGFQLANAAPGAGVAVGMPITWIPVSSGHPTLSLWLYRANEANIEAIQGALVTSMQISLDVGTPLNIAFQAGGTKFFFDPIEITAANKFIDAIDDGGAITTSITAKTYRSPLELASAIESALNAVSVDTWTVTYNSRGASAGKFTIASDGGTTTLTWKTGPHGSDNLDTHIGTKLGFSDAANSTGANTYTSATAQSWADALTPDLDDSDPLVAKGMEILLGDFDNYISPCVQTMNSNVGLDTSDVKCLKASSGITAKSVKKRNNTMEITALLEQHDADIFDRFINGRTTRACFNWGPKDGDNWMEGRSGCLYMPQSKISGFKIQDSDGAAVYAITISPIGGASASPEIFFTAL